MFELVKNSSVLIALNKDEDNDNDKNKIKIKKQRKEDGMLICYVMLCY